MYTCIYLLNNLILACASTCNVLFMRFHELYDGIEVLDDQNKPIGVSKIAAKKVRLKFFNKNIYIYI